jgi:hypothetical protein
MAKLESLFDAFRSNIEPDEDAVAYAQDAHTPVRECLEKQDAFKEYVEGSFLYGSYKRHTAIGDIKDVDIVVLTNLDIADEENTPQKALKRLRDALARCYDDPENPEYQRRSIRIDQPLPNNPEVELTLDVIPAVVVTDGDEPIRVPDRVVQKWIWSHPKGHLKHTTSLNSDEYSEGRFVPLVKMMKWWWKYQCEIRQPDVDRPKPKGFWVECLTGENLDTSKHYWADHFIAVLENISTQYSDINEVPELQDPGLEGETIKTNMTLEEFQRFMEAVNESLELAVLARDATDQVKSSELWREVFGEAFPLYDAEETGKTQAEAKALVLEDHSHAQEMPWPQQPQKKYKVRLDAYLYRSPSSGKSGGINSNGRVITSGWRIKFVAKTRARGDFEVYWQVVNTGRHAEIENGLRGEFFRATLPGGGTSSDPLINWERALYTGKHWIECFIVKDDICVARSGRFFVNIRNPDF